MDLKDYLRAQDRAVLASFLDLDWCICAAISLTALRDLAGKRAATVEQLPGYEAADAAVVRRAGHAELWLRARRRDYTGPFLVFAKREYEFSSSSVPAGYDVDHLFSKGRVATTEDADDERLPPATMVRMLLVESSVNRSFGGLMESAMVGTGNRRRDVRRFTYFQAAKALSIHANLHGGGLGGANEVSNLGHVVEEFVRRGVADGLGMGREQLMQQLQQQSLTVQHFRSVG